MGLNDKILDFEGGVPLEVSSTGVMILDFFSSDFMGKFWSSLSSCLKNGFLTKNT